MVQVYSLSGKILLPGTMFWVGLFMLNKMIDLCISWSVGGVACVLGLRENSLPMRFTAPALVPRNIGVKQTHCLQDDERKICFRKEVLRLPLGTMGALCRSCRA